MYRILHISDLHARVSTQWSTTPILRQAKKVILKKASELNIDLVAFTGDIAYSGADEEYEIAKNFLTDLCLGPSGLNIQKGQILVVPGNHDVDRRLIAKSSHAVQEKLENAATQADVAFYYDDHDERRSLLKRHSGYFQFCRTFLGISESEAQCVSRTFKAGKGQIRVDCLNTSWLSRRDKEHRTLLVGQPQLTDLIRSHSEESLATREPDLRIVLMHHPLSDLMYFDETNTGDYLKQNADVVLRGHMHKAESIERVANSGSYLEFAAGALHESVEAANRFSILDVSDDFSEIRIATYVWLNQQWILDRNLYSTSDGVGVYAIKKKDEDRSARSSQGVGVLKEDVGESAEDSSFEASGSRSRSSIPANIPRFLHSASPQDQSVRQSKLEEAISQIRSTRRLVIKKEPGSKHEGFVACVVDEFQKSRDQLLNEVLHFRCGGVSTGREFQDTIELASDHPFQVFGKILRENEPSILIFDDLDFHPASQDSNPPTVDDTLDALHDFCPNISIIRLTSLPCPEGVNSVQVGPLDEADTRSYLNASASRIHLSSAIDYTRVHRVTGGVQLHLDEFVKSLAVCNIEEAIAQAREQATPSVDVLHGSIVNEITELKNSSVDDMVRSRDLLWTLTILEQGESLESIKWLNDHKRIWPKHATYLQSKGCLEATVVSSRFVSTGRYSSANDGDKILRIPKLVRDYVRSIMSLSEREEVTRNVAKLYFSEGWRLGVVRMRRRLSVGTQVSTHQSGNELAILKQILLSPSVYFPDSPSMAFTLALSFVNQLKSKAYYGEAYEAAKDTLAILEGMNGSGPAEETYLIQLLAASCARMVGEKEACVEYLQTAMPAVRESGIKSTLTSALVDLSLSLHSLNRIDQARDAASEVMKMAPKDSGDYLQAKAIVIQIDKPRNEAVRLLRSIANKAKGLRLFTVADNAMLDVASDCDNTEDKLRMLNDIKSRRELNFNFVRATLRRIETLMDTERFDELTAVDREDLIFSYHLAYTQRMSSIFDWCHRVFWRYLAIEKNNEGLAELFMHSSFVWRLRGESSEELEYTRKLQREMSQGMQIQSIPTLYGYLVRRLSMLVR